jgi:phosphoserine aminotransferase
LIERRSAHAVFGEFSSKFAAAVTAMPFLEAPVVAKSDPGTHPVMEATDGVDAYALTHSETSTGVAMPVQRPAGEGLVLVDATSAAGGLAVDPAEFDAYYFSPQKAFASEGGLWLALLSPEAIDRIGRLTSGDRYIPTMLDLSVALNNSRLEQTYNTPSVGTVFLMAEQIEWMNAKGGLAWAVKDCAAKAGAVYDWADASDFAAPFVADPSQRSNVVCTVDLDESVPADELTGVLRTHGILDIEAYRKLGRNQVRIAVFPAIEAEDVTKLLAAIDHVAAALGS